MDALPAARPAGYGSLLPGLGILGIALGGVALGLIATDLVLDRGWDPGAVTIGSWVGNPRIGTPSIDPYARAVLARSGDVPMAANEGLAFRALTDDTGYRLLRSCAYRLSDLAPAARFWTLAAADEAGHPMADPAHRSGFTSSTVVRDMTGTVTIETGPAARPGNWLPTTGVGPMSLVLRLYDTPLTGNPNAAANTPLPAITRLSCAAQSVSSAP